jgi:hypothetical protein
VSYPALASFAHPFPPLRPPRGRQHSTPAVPRAIARHLPRSHFPVHEAAGNWGPEDNPGKPLTGIGENGRGEFQRSCRRDSLTPGRVAERLGVGGAHPSSWGAHQRGEGRRTSRRPRPPSESLPVLEGRPSPATPRLAFGVRRGRGRGRGRREEHEQQPRAQGPRFGHQENVPLRGRLLALVDRQRDHVDVELLRCGPLVRHLRVVHRVVGRRGEEVVRGRGRLPRRLDAGAHDLAPLGVGYGEGAGAAAAAPLRAADDEEEGDEAAEGADVPDDRPRVQGTLALATFCNKCKGRGARYCFVTFRRFPTSWQARPRQTYLTTHPTKHSARKLSDFPSPLMRHLIMAVLATVLRIIHLRPIAQLLQRYVILTRLILLCL